MGLISKAVEIESKNHLQARKLAINLEVFAGLNDCHESDNRFLTDQIVKVLS